jgi:hypothetical protein
MPVAVLVVSMLVPAVQPETAVAVKVDSIAAQTVYREPRTPAAVVAVVKTQVLAVRLDQELLFYGIQMASISQSVQGLQPVLQMRMLVVVKSTQP